jgi:hypothetical protein
MPLNQGKSKSKISLSEAKKSPLKIPEKSKSKKLDVKSHLKKDISESKKSIKEDKSLMKKMSR